MSVCFGVLFSFPYYILFVLYWVASVIRVLIFLFVWFFYGLVFLYFNFVVLHFNLRFNFGLFWFMFAFYNPPRKPPPPPPPPDPRPTSPRLGQPPKHRRHPCFCFTIVCLWYFVGCVFDFCQAITFMYRIVMLLRNVCGFFIGWGFVNGLLWCGFA